MLFKVFVLAFMVHFAAVQCVPLRVLGPTNASPAQYTAIKQATTDAHQQILNVEHVLDTGGNTAHRHLVNAFGPNYNYNQIKQNFQTLKNGKITVVNAEHIRSDGTYYNGQGRTDPNTGVISFGTAFHNSGPQTKAGTVVHEATHALLGTLDNWVPVPPHAYQHMRPYHPVLDPAGHPTVLNGYADSPHLQHLKATNSHHMHMNADSYRILAHTCTYGLHRRAMAESDPVKREYLIRRTAESCMRSTAAKVKQDSESHKSKNGGKKVVGVKKGPLNPKDRKSERGVPTKQGKVPTPRGIAVSPKPGK